MQRLIRNRVAPKSLSGFLLLASFAIAHEMCAAEYQIHGTVNGADGQPQPELRVCVYQRTLGSEQLLGQNVTSVKGAYRVAYSSSQFSKLDGDVSDIVVTVRGPNGGTLHKETVFSPAQDVTLNILLRASDSAIVKANREIPPKHNEKKPVLSIPDPISRKTVHKKPILAPSRGPTGVHSVEGASKNPKASPTPRRTTLDRQ
jgi:hypothetical protein